MKKLYLGMLVLLLAGCFGPSGGGSIHNAPESIQSGEQLVLVYELSVWGSGPKDVEKRYKDVKCHFRVSGSEDFDTNNMQLVEKDTAEGVGIYECTIPAGMVTSGTTIEYFFDEYLDDHYNKRDVETISVP